MSPRSILLDLLPKEIVLLELLHSWMTFLQTKRVVFEFLRRQEHIYQALIGLLLLLYLLLPFFFLGR